MAFGDKITNAGFYDRTVPGLYGFNFPGAKVNSDYAMSLVCKARCGDRAHVAQSKYTNRCSHSGSFPHFLRYSTHANGLGEATGIGSSLALSLCESIVYKLSVSVRVPFRFEIVVNHR